MTNVPRVPSSSSGVCNTKGSTPLLYWFFTYNNYDPNENVPMFQEFQELCSMGHCQEEKGKSGTPHIQGTLKFKVKKRFEYLCKRWPKIHWEPCKSEKANTYCTKERTRDGQQWIWGVEVKQEIELHRPDHEIFDKIEKMINEKPDNRTINWFVDFEGNVGKSAFSKYMFVKYGVTVVTSSKSADILTCVEENVKMIIFDFPRCSNVGTYCPFNAIEQIKNGFITDCKLKKKGRILAFNSPHVVIFSNEPPDTSKLSGDRWNIEYFTPNSEATHMVGNTRLYNL